MKRRSTKTVQQSADKKKCSRRTAVSTTTSTAITTRPITTTTTTTSQAASFANVTVADFCCFFVQSFGDAYRLMDIAGIESAQLPFIVKNETGMHVSVKPDDSFEVIMSF